MLKFTKMEGIGNDYVYIDNINQTVDNPSELSKKISDRHFGIGSDGLILISRSDVADFKMNIYNPDGSEAEMCGNGIRCVGKFVYDKGLTDKTEVTIETLAGIKTLELTLENGKVSLVKVDMGEPILEADKIPVINYELQKSSEGISFVNTNTDLLIRNKIRKLTCVSMGNPHAICFVDNVNDIDIEKIGSTIENDENFPNRTNVEFIDIVNSKEINMRVWERGAGETLACGTGACASVVASVLNGYTEREVIVNLLGGKLEISYDENDNHVYLKGPARIVYEGEIDLD